MVRALAHDPTLAECAEERSSFDRGSEQAFEEPGTSRATCDTGEMAEVLEHNEDKGPNAPAKIVLGRED